MPIPISDPVLVPPLPHLCFLRAKLTCIVLDAATLDAVLDVGQCTKGGNDPAVAETALFNVTAKSVLHEGGLLVNLVDSLDSLGNSLAGTRSRAMDVKLVGPKVVQSVTFDHLQIPVLFGKWLAQPRSMESDIRSRSDVPDRSQGPCTGCLSADILEQSS